MIPVNELIRGYNLYRDEYEAKAIEVLRSGWYILGKEVESALSFSSGKMDSSSSVIKKMWTGLVVIFSLITILPILKICGSMKALSRFLLIMQMYFFITPILKISECQKLPI